MSKFRLSRRRPAPAARAARRPRLELLEDRTVPAGNPILAENQLAGTPQSVWGVSGAGDASIQGFATDISVDHGQAISFKINDTANKPYHIDLYRMGYYQGNGARLVATIASAQVLQQVQPNPLVDTATGLVDAGNWAVSATWSVPASAVSGLYFARVTRNDTGGAFLIYFVVRDDEGGSDLLFQTSDTTWQAYNTWGGYSLYQHTGPAATLTASSSSDPGRAVKVSYNRPLTIDAVSGGYGSYNSPLHGEYPMIRWLEANGYNVSYTTDVDTDRRGSELLEHKAYLSVGHDEYWSGGQRASVEAARDAGVNLAFFSGNESFWKTRWETSVDGSGTPYRTLVCYKESKDGVRSDPLDISQNIWTGTWRDTRLSPPADGGRPENGMSGTIYMNDRTSTDLGVPLTVGDQDGKLRFWRNTAVANLAAGATATLGQFTVGYETDEDLDNGFRPAGLIDMSATTFSTGEHVIVPWGTEVGPGTSTHKITLYRAASGALVFAAGSVQWSWGLDGNHNDTSTTPNVSMQQATVNLLADMGVQPGSLQAGLVAATASTDHTAPTSTITAPAAGSVVQAGTTVTITGTAADAGGGLVGGVEVSVDGGATWHPATGRGTWTYTWNPTSGGPVVIKSRAVDDSGNLETPSAGVSVTVSTSGSLVAAYSFDEGTGSTVADASGKGNTGTISAATWSTAGKYGNALSFNGTSSWVTVASASSLNLTAAMTLEAWVMPTAVSTDWTAVLLKERPAGLAYALYATDGANRPPAGYINSGADVAAVGSSALPLNAWSHLAATYDGSTIRLYVNGVQVSNRPQTGGITTSSSPLRIGGDSVWGEYFKGLIDEVRVYNRALTQSDIQSDMNTRVNSDTQPPTAPASLSASGSISSVSLSWSAATDNVGIDHYNVYRSTTSGFTPGPTNLIGQLATTAYTDPGLAPGTYYYVVTALDAAANASPPSPQASAVVTGDITAPTVSVTSPANGATVSGVVTVTATASDDVGVVGVQLQVNGTNFGAEDTTAPYSVSWNTVPGGNGTFTLTAVARDAAGHNTTSAPVTVTVNNVPDTTAPTVSLTAPANGATVSGNVSVTANASDNIGVVGVQFKLDGANLGAEVTSAPYAVTWNTTTATNGTHTLTAVARDAANNTATATTVTVTVNNVTGLVGAWGFEEGSGTTTADASGHTLTGTLSNATWVTGGKYGKALSFNGTSAWVTVADNALLHLTNGMTVEAWVMPTAASTDWTAVAIKERGTTGLAYALYATDGANKPPAGYINRGTDVEAAGTSALPLNAWSYLTVTYDGATIRLYVNGTQVATKAQTGNISSSTAPFRIGGDSVWGEYFKGLIDEVRVYNVARTAAQVQTDMNAPVGGPQLAAEGAAPAGAAPAPALTAAALAPVAAEAVRRWEAAGLDPAQTAALRRTQFRIADLGATPVLALTPTGGSVVTLDDDGAGRGWFADPTPADDAEFAAAVAPAEARAPGGPAAGRYDLLTVVMHELGHVLGQDDLDPAAAPHDLLTATLPLGTRRLPAPAAAAPAVLSELPNPRSVFGAGPLSSAVVARTASRPAPDAGGSPATRPPVTTADDEPVYVGGPFVGRTEDDLPDWQRLRPFLFDRPDRMGE